LLVAAQSPDAPKTVALAAKKSKLVTYHCSTVHLLLTTNLEILDFESCYLYQVIATYNLHRLGKTTPIDFPIIPVIPDDVFQYAIAIA
jgi:hypothetical protein